MKEFLTDPPSLLSTIAIVFSGISLIVAILAFRRSQIEHKERYLSIHAYLSDSYREKIDEHILVCFGMTYTNPSTLPDSLSRTELHVLFTG